MRLSGLLGLINDRRDNECLVYRDRSLSCRDLEGVRQLWLARLKKIESTPGDVIGLRADCSPEAIGLLLAILSNRRIACLLPGGSSDDEGYLQDARAVGFFDLQDDDSWEWSPGSTVPDDHALLRRLRSAGGSGIIIFSSGSTGQPKAILHDADRFLSKFSPTGKQLRTLAFLLFDHVAGLDTVFYTLGAGGVLVIPEQRDSRYICSLIEQHRVEVLPTSPTFLRLLCLSGDHEEFDLSSLRIITYGAEPMDEATLRRLREVFPDVRLSQKYGTSEFGSPRTISPNNESLWMRLSGEHLETNVVDDVLWVRTRSSMLGYLNAPSPFNSRGWICTGDIVERAGDWIRIVGRKSDIIMVGGEKVDAREVEAVLSEQSFVIDAVVRGEPQPLTGQIVAAEVRVDSRRLSEGEDAIRRKIRSYCRSRLEPYKVPVRIRLTPGGVVSQRKKKR